MAFSKSSGSNAILAVVSLDPWHWEEATITLDLEMLGVTDLARPFEVHDLLTDATYLWHGRFNYVRLEPESPAHIFEVRA
jgi:starch synthase (maltosyl-transferring)